MFLETVLWQVSVAFFFMYSVANLDNPCLGCFIWNETTYIKILNGNNRQIQMFPSWKLFAKLSSVMILVSGEMSDRTSNWPASVPGIRKTFNCWQYKHISGKVAVNEYHWKPSVVMISTLLSLVASGVVIRTTFVATSDGRAGIMATVGFQLHSTE